MCLLVVLRGVDPDFPVIVAANRDELRERRFSPPGLTVGQYHRSLSPKDRRAGGTWLGINDAGLFAGLTNVAGAPDAVGAPSRGGLPLLALDRPDVASAAEAVRERVEREEFSAFQLLLASATEMSVLYHHGGVLELERVDGDVAVISNEHRLGDLELPGVAPARADGLGIEGRLDALSAVLLDAGADSGHRVLKSGGEWGTVSSTLLAVPDADGENLRDLRWRFCAGTPDEKPYRNYGNLGRRLLEE